MKTQEQKIVIPCSKSYDFVNVSDIVRCEGMQNYTKVFLQNGDTIISSCNLGVYGKALRVYGFFTCHKSHVINTQKIVRYYKEGFIEMTDASVAPVSRRRKENFFLECMKNIPVVGNHKNA